MVTITRIRFEHHDAPAVGIGHSTPRISWSFEGDSENWMQASYELQIRRRNGQVENHTINSQSSILVPWFGEPLSSSERAEVRVRATPEVGAVTDWSSPAIVEAGLLEKDDWKCQLIEPTIFDPPDRPIVFSSVFSVPQRPVSARLYITAHGIYSASLNKKAVGDHVLSPGWTSYPHRLPYQTFNVLDQIQLGENS